jgi:ribosomal protein L14
LYKGFNRKCTYKGYYTKGSAKIVEPPRIEYKGFKYKYSVKGDIIRQLVVRSVYKIRTKEGLSIKTNSNAGVIIKKKNNPQSKFLNGPIERAIKRHKWITLFKKVL